MLSDAVKLRYLLEFVDGKVSGVVMVLNHCTMFGRGERVCSPSLSKQCSLSLYVASKWYLLPCSVCLGEWFLGQTRRVVGQTHRSAPTVIIIA